MEEYLKQAGSVFLILLREILAEKGAVPQLENLGPGRDLKEELLETYDYNCPLHCLPVILSAQLEYEEWVGDVKKGLIHKRLAIMNKSFFN